MQSSWALSYDFLLLVVARRVGRHVLADVGGLSGEALVAVLERDRRGHARVVDVVPEHFLGDDEAGPCVAGDRARAYASVRRR